MLLWGTRAIFLIIIVAVLLVNLTAPEVSGEIGRANFYAILWAGLIFAVGALLVDFLTPKKSLAALAGVFFGLLVGIV
ncbi:MAG: hypothetical protein ABSH16_02385, partial [Sedimentisphaerales bacterium]